MWDRILTGVQFSLFRLSHCFETGDTSATFHSSENTLFQNNCSSGHLGHLSIYQYLSLVPLQKYHLS